MQPSPCADTVSPCVPSVRVCMPTNLGTGVRSNARRYDTRDYGHGPPEGSHGPQPRTGLLQVRPLGAMSASLPLATRTAIRHDPGSTSMLGGVLPRHHQRSRWMLMLLWPRLTGSITGGPPSEPPHLALLPPCPQPPPRRN